MDIHCQDCGATTRQVTQDDGCEVLVCTDDYCPRVVVMVLAVPDVDEGPLGLASHYSQRWA